MEKRTLWLSQKETTQPKSIMYVMSRDQRVLDNFALLAAQTEALEYQLPLVVVFNLLPKLGVRAREHYEFMIQGLQQVEADLKKLAIPFLITTGAMPAEVEKLTTSLQPRTVYFDFSPLRGPRAAQKEMASRLKCRVAVVDTHNIVPTWVLSDKQEFAAHTIRRKLHKQLAQWLHEPATMQKHPFSLSELPQTASWDAVQQEVAHIESCGIKHGFDSGERAAHDALERFIETGLDTYATRRNDPSADAQSNLSPYLHFGQLSALRIVLDIMTASDHAPLLLREAKMPSASDVPTRDDSIDAFIEELVVRRELSDNFCFYNSHYDDLNGAPDWAKQSLAEHKDDPREFEYSLEQFEAGNTHDTIWNAAQLQLTRTGKIHGYMRMYWTKKILEWSESADEAIKIAVYLNDHYSIDGGDPNGYVGILWSITGLHDRPWFERSVYGKVRYMNASGLSRKFDTDAYVQRYS